LDNKVVNIQNSVLSRAGVSQLEQSLDYEPNA